MPSSLIAASDDLVKTLTGLGICEVADIRRATAYVRQLARDLPAFDSIWIDALVQSRCLTHHQARMIEEGHAADLRVGAWVITDQLGHGVRGTTSLAKWHRSGAIPREMSRIFERSVAALKRLRLSEIRADESIRRIDELIERTRAWTHPNVVVPSLLVTTFPEQTRVGRREIAIASRYVAGTTLSELLVRRGRIPPDVVMEITRQLIEGLAALDARGIVHGDLCLTNVRVTRHGVVVLVDAGVRSAVLPELTIHDTLSFDGYDGIAPELIGTGITQNVSSDVYGLGCLLWQLLAGRPPYPTADPLMKLTAHQTSRIDEIRTWVPDTPALLADTIFAMTSPHPQDRPGSFGELRQRLGGAKASGRTIVRSYRAKFDQAVPHLTPSNPIGNRNSFLSNRMMGVGIAACLMAAAAVLASNPNRRLELVEITDRAFTAVRKLSNAKPMIERQPNSPSGQDSLHSNSVVTSRGTEKENGTASDGKLAADDRTLATAGQFNGKSRSGSGSIGQHQHLLKPIPAPLPSGEILLESDGPYDAADIHWDGELTIRGAAGCRPVILIGETPMRLAAETVQLTRVIIRREESEASKSPGALLLIEANRLRVEEARFELQTFAKDRDSGFENATFEDVSSGSNRTAGIAWTQISPNESRKDISSAGPGIVSFSDVFVAGGSAFLLCAESPGEVQFKNVLRIGSGPLMTLGRKATPRVVHVDMRQVTTRGSNVLLRVGGAFASDESTPALSMDARDCVFSMLPQNQSRVSRLVEMQADQLRRDVADAVAFTGERSVVTHGVEMLMFRDASNGRDIVVEDADESFQGLIASELGFAGPPGMDVTTSQLTSISGPRSKDNFVLPGIDSKSLTFENSKKPL